MFSFLQSPTISHSRSGQNSRFMERKSVGLAHQYKVANDSISCSAAVSSQLLEWSHTAVFRQYNSCCLFKLSRGEKIGPAFSPSHKDVVLVPGKGHCLFSSLHAKVRKSLCIPSVSSKKSFNRMDAESSSFLSNCGHLWPTVHGSFHFCSRSPGKEICFVDRRPRGPGHRRYSSQLGERGGLGRSVNVCILSFQLDPEMSAINDRRQSSNSACDSSMEIQTIVSNNIGPSDRSAMSTATDPLLVHLPWENLPHPLLSYLNFRLTVWPLSSILCSRRMYQKGCPKLYWLHGKRD